MYHNYYLGGFLFAPWNLPDLLINQTNQITKRKQLVGFVGFDTHLFKFINLKHLRMHRNKWD